MSPEQCMGKELDARSDIYSLGCVMYEIFGGRPPFEADTFYEMVRQHVDRQPSPLPFNKPKIFTPAPLKAIIFKCLQKDPNLRYQSAEQLLKDLSVTMISEAISA